MKLKKEYLLLLLSIAILSVYLVMRSKDHTHFELPQLPGIESQKINRLVITKGDGIIEITKRDDHWVVGPKSYPADDTKVKNMLKAAADLNITALVSESGNYERYDLTDDKKIMVQAYADKEVLRNFAIGRQAPTNQHTFVRLADDPKVYHARGTINFTFDHTVDELRDETVLAFEKSDISGLTIARGKRTLTLVKKEMVQEKKDQDQSEDKKAQQPPQTQTQWTDAAGNAASNADVERLIGDFYRLKCDDFLEDDAREGLKEPLWTVTFNSEKTNHALSVFEKQTTESIEFPAISSGTAYAFILHKSRVEGFEKLLDKLLDLKIKK